MTHSAAITSLALALIMAAPAAHARCGPAEGACTLPDGSYELVLPSDGQGAVPAVMFLHGHGGSARGVLSMRGVISELTDRGYAVIAPNGARRAEDGPRSWSFCPHLVDVMISTFYLQYLRMQGSGSISMSKPLFSQGFHRAPLW